MVCLAHWQPLLLASHLMALAHKQSDDMLHSLENQDFLFFYLVSPHYYPLLLNAPAKQYATFFSANQWTICHVSICCFSMLALCDYLMIYPCENPYPFF